MTDDVPKRAPQQRGTDWQALRLEYVNGVMSLRQLAEAHSIDESGVMHHSAKEGWEDERKRLREQASKAAQAKLSKSRVDELAEFSALDLAIAKAGQKHIAARFRLANESKAALSAVEIKTLMQAAAGAQQLGRTALGADSDGPPLDDDETPDPVAVTIDFKDARRRKPDEPGDGDK